MKVLLLPLFTFPTGHSKVSNTMAEWILRKYPQAEIVEMDLLSYSQPRIEKLISSFYLRWIQWSPKSYGYIYSRWAGRQKDKSKQSKMENFITSYFGRKLYQYIQEVKPEFIYCTHSFASRVAINVKETYGLQIPVINVYTDLFINGVWEVEKANYHFVPTLGAKREIKELFQLRDEQIFVTGIPIHPDFTEKPVKQANKRLHVLIAGGNTGLMDIAHLHHLIEHYPHLKFTILCGKNKKLYDDLQAMTSSTIHIKSYIQSTKEMNELYDTVDAIISKPGGVTISEVIYKEIPLYISHSLPGPEQINLQYLEDHKMATSVTLSTLTAEKDNFCSPIVLEEMINQMRRHRAVYTHTVLAAIESLVLTEQRNHQSILACSMENVNNLSSVGRISS